MVIANRRSVILPRYAEIVLIIADSASPLFRMLDKDALPERHLARKGSLVVVEALDDSKVIILTALSNEYAIVEPVVAGTISYIQNFYRRVHLLSVIRDVAAGVLHVVAQLLGEYFPGYAATPNL